MATNLGARSLVYLSVKGSGPDPSIVDLEKQGWRLWAGAGQVDVLQLLAQHPDEAFAGVLDLASGADPLPPAEVVERMASALACTRVGWVAAVTADQLDVGWVRRLVHDYCHDYVTLPAAGPVLGMVLGHAHGMARLSLGEPRAVEEMSGLDDMVGESPPMRAMFRSLRKAAASNAPVFIAGETGTGKELAALALHKHSSRQGMPFVAINCGTIPEGLVQSELFGYERGAFTGAAKRKLGRIELAHRGTLFLDEIGDMPMASQVSLLRFLEQGCIERLGGHDQVRLDVRIVSATHVDLLAAIEAGRFREDLFHRLRVIELRQPALRDRGDDIERIATHALERYAGDATRRIRGFAPCALRAMRRHDWPGNVRELINSVRQAMVMAEGRCITAEDLRLPDAEAATLQTLGEARSVGERESIERALHRNGHRLVATARDLGISRVTLYRLMARHGLRELAEGGSATRID